MDINLGLTADATGTVDVITATYSPAPTLVDKKILFLVSSGANTVTTPTFSPNGLTARTIVKRGGQALAIGDTGLATNVMILEYNLANTRWELLNPALTLVTQTITTGVTTTAPSEAAVFNALALKATRYTKFFSWSVLASPLDANIYYSGNIQGLSLAQVSAGGARNMKFGTSGTLKEVSLSVVLGSAASSELVTIYIRNLTTTTDYTIGTFALNLVSPFLNTFVFSGLSIAVNATDEYVVKFLTPTWVTNPTSWYGGGELYIL